METDYKVSLQLIDAQWRKAAQSDAEPQEGAASTSTWSEGDRVEEQRRLAIVEEAAPGIYNLRLYVYAMRNGDAVHVPVSYGAHRSATTHIVLTRVRVEPR